MSNLNILYMQYPSRVDFFYFLALISHIYVHNITYISLLHYFIVKRPDQAYNRPPTLGNLRKPSKADRKGYHYQPIASTSRQSPTFVLDDDPIELELVHDPGPSPRSFDYSSA